MNISGIVFNKELKIFELEKELRKCEKILADISELFMLAQNWDKEMSVSCDWGHCYKLPKSDPNAVYLLPILFISCQHCLAPFYFLGNCTKSTWLNPATKSLTTLCVCVIRLPNFSSMISDDINIWLQLFKKKGLEKNIIYNNGENIITGAWGPVYGKLKKGVVRGHNMTSKGKNSSCNCNKREKIITWADGGYKAKLRCGGTDNMTGRIPKETPPLLSAASTFNEL